MKTKSGISFNTYIRCIKRDEESNLKKEVITGLRLLIKDLEEYEGD